MATNWILVAHRSGARLFSSAGAQAPLTLIDDIEHPEGRLRDGDIDADRPGRAHDRHGDQRHGMSREESPTEHLAAGFARELAARLRAARLEKQFDTLVLVAGPAFLGRLRAALDEHTAASVKASLDKDLGDLPAHDLIEHLKGVL